MSHPSHHPSPFVRRALGAVLAALLGASALAACTSDPEPSSSASASTQTTTAAEAEAACSPDDLPAAVTRDQVDAADTEGTTVTLVTHDSFAVSDGIFDEFTKQTGVKVKLLQQGDAGALVSQAVLTAGKPVADVLFGVDTTFLCRATKAGVFVPYEATGVDRVDDAVRLAPHDLATPIDVGDVCLNYSKATYPDPADAPKDLGDLTDERFVDAFVTEDPQTSSPGLAFLLATIAEYGDQWPDYWKKLRANGVQVESGWQEAYEGAFGSGTGKRSIVTSYATSPVADIVYSDPKRTEPAIGVVADACFRQVELAGILRGTKHPEAAAKLVDFLLSKRFQEDIPLNMFVEPVNPDAQVPAVFEANRTVVDHPLTLSPAAIEANRDAWTEEWTRVVQR